MHRVKGLELIVLCTIKTGFPLESVIDHGDPIAERESYTAEKCLLYVALTRAQKQAYITCYGKKSDFI